MNVHHVSEARLFRQLDGEGLDTAMPATRHASMADTHPGSGIH